MGIKDLWDGLISTKSDISSKRFISIYSLVLFTIVIGFVLIAQIIVQDAIIYALVGLIMGSSVMTLTQSNSSNIDNKSVKIDKKIKSDLPEESEEVM